MSCPPSYYLSESCIPSLVKEEYEPVYFQGNLEGRVIYLRKIENAKVFKITKEEYEEKVEEHVNNFIEKGFNIRLVNFFTPKEIYYTKEFSGLITETGGMLSHAAILAREQGTPFCVLPNATSLFYQGDHVKLKNGKIKRKETNFFTTVVPRADGQKSNHLVSDYYQVTARKILCELAGKRVKIIEPVENFYALNIMPSEYYSLIKEVDVDQLVRVMDKVTGLKKALVCKMMQETAVNFPADKVKYYFKADKIEDEEFDKAWDEWSSKIGKPKTKEEREEKIEKFNEEIKKAAEELVRIIEKSEPMYWDECEGRKNKALLLGDQVMFFKKDEEIPGEIKKLMEKECKELPAWEFGEINLLFFEITNKCNYKCIHCYNNPYRKDEHTISLSDFKKALSELNREYSIHLIQLTGGEPFTVPNLYEYVITALEHANKIQIFTNGSLVNNLDKFEEYKDKLTFRVSFYSLNKETYEKITVNGLFEKTLNNILSMKKEGFRVSVEIPLIPGINENDYSFTSKYFKARGIPTKSSLIIGYGNAVNLEKKKNKGFRMPRNPARRWVVSKNYDNCWATHLAIDPHGNAFPCIFAREYFLGNVLKDRIKSIKNKHEELSMKYKPDNLEECKHCELRYLCKSCLPRAKMFGLEGIKQAHCPSS